MSHRAHTQTQTKQYRNQSELSLNAITDQRWGNIRIWKPHWNREAVWFLSEVIFKSGVFFPPPICTIDSQRPSPKQSSHTDAKKSTRHLLKEVLSAGVPSEPPSEGNLPTRTNGLDMFCPATGGKPSVKSMWTPHFYFFPLILDVLLSNRSHDRLVRSRMIPMLSLCTWADLSEVSPLGTASSRDSWWCRCCRFCCITPASHHAANDGVNVAVTRDKPCKPACVQTAIECEPRTHEWTPYVVFKLTFLIYLFRPTYNI